MGTLSAARRGEIDEAPWDAMIERSTEGWLWHLHAFQDALGAWHRRTDRSFAVVENDEPVAIVPVHEVRGRVDALRRLDLMGGPCVVDSLRPGDRRAVLQFALAELDSLARRRRALHVTVTLPPLAPAYCPLGGVRVNPLPAVGFDPRTSATWVIDLRADEDALFRGIQKGTRSQIKAAERNGVTVRSASNATDLASYLAMHRATYVRSGATPHPAAFFETIADRLVRRGLAELLIAERDGVPLAGAFIGRYKGGANYWTGAGSEEGRRLSAGDLLQWEAIRRARADGCVFYDSGEASVGGAGKDRAISNFKRKFGGRLEPMYRGRRYTTPTPIATALRILDLRPWASTTAEEC